MYESCESGGAAPEWRIAMQGVNSSQHLVARRELTRCDSESLCRERPQFWTAIVRKFSNRMRPSRESFGCCQRVRLLFQSSNDFSR